MAFSFDIPGQILNKLGGRPPERFEVKEHARSKTGSPFWATDMEGRWYYMPVKLGGVELWNPVMRAIARKTIVETKLTERNGSVKEIISQDDYVLNIKGWIKKTDNVWPEEEVRQLNELFRRNEALEIDSALTCILLEGQDEMAVIKSLSFPTVKGETAVMYELELITDVGFDLEF